MLSLFWVLVHTHISDISAEVQDPVFEIDSGHFLSEKKRLPFISSQFRSSVVNCNTP